MQTPRESKIPRPTENFRAKYVSQARWQILHEDFLVFRRVKINKSKRPIIYVLGFNSDVVKPVTLLSP